MSAMSNVLAELKWRGLVAHTTDESALAEALESGPLTFYVGFDPSAPSIHFGNLVQLMVARWLQRAGHKPLLLVGGSTGLIGDPKESGERSMNSRDVVSEWVQRIQKQVSRLISFDGDNGAVILNNLDWTSKISVVDFLRDIGKHFPVNRMLDRDLVARRLAAGGLSFAEFSYVLLQSFDYLHLSREYNCVLETGGSDQWGNITAGVELIRRCDGKKVHALSTPLLTKADGTKFGKTESGTVWLDPELTSPYAFHQYFLNIEDSQVIKLLKVFSERSREEIMELEEKTNTEPHLRLAQRALADDITDLVHGKEQRITATQAAAALFGKGSFSEFSQDVLLMLFKEIGGGNAEFISGELPAATALVTAGVVESKSAARRTIKEGGAYLNNEKITDPEAVLTQADLVAGRFAVLRRGRKRMGILDFGPGA